MELRERPLDKGKRLVIMITNTMNEIKQSQNRGLRMTPQRRAILEELQKSKFHPTAADIYAILRRRLPRISLGTVYRNLDLLAKRGTIRTLEMAGAQRRFDADVGQHYHVRCVRCGRVDDLPIRTVHAIDRAVRGTTDYNIIGHVLKFVGLCRRCKGREGGKLKWSSNAPGND